MRNQESNQPSSNANRSLLGRLATNFWLRAVLIVAFTLPTAGYFYVQHSVKSTFKQQLAAAFSGPVKIGSAQLRFNGLSIEGATANDIQILADRKSTKPFVTIGSLSANGSYSDLTSGRIKSLNVDRLSIQLELDADGNLQTLPWVEGSSEVQLPAETVNIKDAKLSISQPGKSDLTVEAITATLSKDGNRFPIQGNATAFDSNWQLDGYYTKTDWQLKLSSDNLTVNSQHLTGVAGIPNNVVEPLEFSGSTTATIDFAGSKQDPFRFLASFRPSNIDFAVPDLDVHLTIASADVHLDGPALTVNNAKGIIGGGEFEASGKTEFNLPAANGNFEVKLRKVQLDSLHTLASIPKTAHGKLNGEGSGNFNVNQSNGFHLDFKATGKLNQVSYEDLPLQTTDVEIQLDGLELAATTYAFQSLSGLVDLETSADRLDLYRFVTNLGLVNDPDRRLAKQFGGATDAKIQITIPLATAGNLRSWDLLATTDQGTIDLASQQLKDVDSTIRFVDGKVAIEKLVGTGPHIHVDPNEDNTNDGKPDSAHRIYVSGTWPIPQQEEPASPSDSNSPVNPDGAVVEAAQENQQERTDSTDSESSQEDQPEERPSDSATFEIQGTQVSVQWLLGIAKDYNVDIKNMLAQTLPNSTNSLEGVGGHLTVNASLTIPTATANDFLTWNVTAEITSGDIRIEDQYVDQLSGRFRWIDQVVHVSDLEGKLNGSEDILVNVDFPMDEQKPASVHANLPAVPSAWIITLGKKFSPDFAQIVQQLEFDSNPPLDGSLKLDVNIDRLAAKAEPPNHWNVELGFQSENLTIKDKPVKNLDGKLLVDQKQITIPKLNLTFEDGSSIKTNGRWPLKSNQPDLQETETGQLNIETLQLPIKWLLELVPDIEQQIGSVDQQLDWSFSDENLNRFRSSDERARLDKVSPDPLSGFANYVAASKISGKILVEQKRNSVLKVGGNLTAAPMKLRFGRSQLDSEPIHLTLNAKLVTNNFVESSGSVRAKSLNGRWNNYEIENIDASINYVTDDITLHAQADMLDGHIELGGAVPLASKKNATPKPLHLTIESIQIRSLTAALLGRQEDALSANLNANLDISVLDDSWSVDDGNASLRDIAWQQNRLSEGISLDVSVRDNIMTINNIRGDLAGGQATGKFRLALDSGNAGDYELNLRRINLRIPGRAVREYSHVSEEFSGFADLRIRGNIGRGFDGNGTLAFHDATLWDVDVDELKLPIRFQFDPNSLAGKIEFRQSQFPAFGGTIRGKGEIEFGRRLDIAVDAKLNRIDSDQLISAFASQQNLGQGEIFGSLKLSGTSIRSLRDLDGEFTGRIERARSFQIPLLRNLAIFLNSGQLTQKQFDSDDIILRLANGRLNVQRLTFSSDAAQMFITGDVSTEGRLDLEVAARIANLSGNRQLYERLAGSPVTALASPAGAAVTQVTEFLSNRIVYLHVGGTASHPSFRLKTGQILRDQVLQQFFATADQQFLTNLPASR